MVVPLRDRHLRREDRPAVREPKTRRQYVDELADLFAWAGRSHPSELTEGDVFAWCAGADKRMANNTIRNRLSRVTVFLRWWVRRGLAEPASWRCSATGPTRCGASPPLREAPGEAPRPLAHLEHAFGQQLGTCRGMGEFGLRDELVLRLGLAGARAEMIGLRLGEIHLDDSPPQIRCIGKVRRPRRTVCGPELVAVLGSYLQAYRAHSARCDDPDAFMVCRQKPGGGRRHVPWGDPICHAVSLQRIVRVRAEAAGLGRMSPHALLRTAAGILHRAVSTDGGHLFDLL